MFTYHDALAYYGIGGAHPGGLALTKKIMDKETIHPYTTILDAGCGTGQTAAFLMKTYKCKVTALDNHHIMLEKAKQRFIHERLSINVLHGSVENIPAPMHSFNFIITESVTAFTDPQKTLKEYYRVLKPNGVLINLDMTAEAPLNEKEEQKIKEVYGISYVLTEEEWKEEITLAGFKKIEVLSMESVHSFLNKNLQNPEQLPDFHPSSMIDPQIENILNQHHQLTTQLSHKLGYRVFRSNR